jgi:hypothetical protein
MGLRMFRAPVSIVLALLFLIAPLGVMGEGQTKFTGNVTEKSISFPRMGGFNSDITVELPKHIIVTGASMEITGGNVTYDPLSATIDFNNPGQSTAWEAGTSLPPNQAPTGYQTTNKTSDGSLDASDNIKMTLDQKMTYVVHMFRFYVGDNIVNSFNFKWEGTGYSEGTLAMEGVDLFIYKGANTWEKLNATGGGAIDDYVLWINMTTNAGDYVDKGYVSFLATTRDVAAFYYSHLETDYVSFAYTGTERFYPEFVKLDVGGDGSNEWYYNSTLKDTQTFSGEQFIWGIQRVCDASASENVSVKLRFQIMKGGSLTVGNLTIDFDRKDLPPKLLGQGIPPKELDEDKNATGLVDLWTCFSDDKGVGNLTYTIVYEQDDTKLDAVLASDGHTIDFTTKTANWFGSLKFRAMAEDASGQRIESNNFTVNVLPVNDPPKLRAVPLLVCHEGAPFVYNLNATDVDTAMVPEETLKFATNADFLTLDSETGRISFTPRNQDVGQHFFWVNVTDMAGANDTKSVTLKVENENNAPVLQVVEDQTLTEDVPFSMMLNATDADLSLGLDTLLFSDNSSLFNVATNWTIAFTPLNKDVGIHSVSVSVTDSGGLKDTCNFTITVVNVNDPPKIQPVKELVVDEDTNVTLKINASDEDVGDVLKFKDNSSLFDINSTGWISFRPVQKDVGVYRINISVSDVEGASAAFDLVLTVRNVNDAPRDARIKVPANGTAIEQGKLLSFEGTASDEDGDLLNYTWYSDGAAIGNGQNLSTKAQKTGKHTIGLKVTDGQFEISAPEITVTIKAKPATGKKTPGFEAMVMVTALVLAAACLVRRKN